MKWYINEYGYLKGVIRFLIDESKWYISEYGFIAGLIVFLIILYCILANF